MSGEFFAVHRRSDLTANRVESIASMAALTVMYELFDEYKAIRENDLASMIILGEPYWLGGEAISRITILSDCRPESTFQFDVEKGHLEPEHEKALCVLHEDLLRLGPTSKAEGTVHAIPVEAYTLSGDIIAVCARPCKSVGEAEATLSARVGIMGSCGRLSHIADELTRMSGIGQLPCGLTDIRFHRYRDTGIVSGFMVSALLGADEPDWRQVTAEMLSAGQALYQ